MAREKRAKVKVTKKREVRTHSYLFHTSGCLLEKGQQEDKASFHQFMASVVFTAFTLEAYLNWLGDSVFPHWTYLERLSPLEKLELISDQLGVKADYSLRPWQTIKSLFKFRNTIAHGKPEEISRQTDEPLDQYLDATLGKFVRTEWETYCTRQTAERAREDVKRILETLHKCAKPGDRTGPLFPGMQTHSATL